MCINDSNQGFRQGFRIINRVKLGEIYTIRQKVKCKVGYGYYLEEFICGYNENNDEIPFDVKRFRPVDYTFGDKIEKQIQELINE